jgi:hypothetical protein
MASLVFEVLGGLLTRVSLPAQLGAVLAPIKALALLGLLAVIADSLVTAAGQWLGRVPLTHG